MSLSSSCRRALTRGVLPLAPQRGASSPGNHLCGASITTIQDRDLPCQGAFAWQSCDLRNWDLPRSRKQPTLTTSLFEQRTLLGAGAAADGGGGPFNKREQ